MTDKTLAEGAAAFERADRLGLESDESTDERLHIEFDTERRMSEVFPWREFMSDAYRTCSHHEADGSRSKQTFPTSELWIVKTHHDGTNGLGSMQIYCSHHLINRGNGGTSERGSGRTGAVCPNCNVTVPLTGICDECGWSAKSQM
jgi:hypothetical protein